MSGSFPRIDSRAARRRFERAAASYLQASRLEAEIGSRMLERLDYVKIAPRRVLDAGSGPAREAKALRSRYARAELLEMDFSLAMLRQGQGGLRLFGPRRIRLCADMAQIPLAGGAVELVWSNMALHWAGDPLAVLREFHRVLATEGLLMFSSLGPDTLKELRAAAGPARVHQFVDMHDLGDMLVESGFAAPVMDMETLTMAYPDGQDLLADLRAAGQTSARADRPRGLSGKGLRARLREKLPARATFEVIYGHAWKGTPRKLSDGRDIVQFRSRSGGLP